MVFSNKWPPMSNIGQLLFDCDGVLVDSEIIAAHAMVEMLSQYGIEITVDYYLNNCTGKTYSGLVIELGEKFGAPLPSHFLSEVTKEVDYRLETQLKPIDGINHLLESLHLPKSIVSNSDVYQIEHAIEYVNIAHYFTHVFSCQMVARPKPDPGVYLHAATTLNVDPLDCLVVEDSLAGATAALSAGMNVIGFAGGSHIVKGHAEKLMNIGVTHVAGSIQELGEMIDFVMS